MRPLALLLLALFPLCTLLPLQAAEAGSSIYDPAELKMGKNLWTLPLDELSPGAKTEWGKVYGDDLLILDSNATLHCIDVAQGTHKWVLMLGERPCYEPGVFGNTVGVVIKDRLVMVKRSTGARIMDKHLEFSPCAAPTCTENTAYAPSLFKEKLISVDASSGLSGWTFRFKEPVTAAPKLYGEGAGRFLYAVSHDGTVACFAPKAAPEAGPKRPEWSYKTGDQNTADPVLTGDLLLVASRDGALYAFNRLSGAVRWKFFSGVALTCPPLVIGDKVFQSVGCTVHCLDLSTGAEKWKHEGVDAVAGIAGTTAYLWHKDASLTLVNVESGEEIRKVEPLAPACAIPNTNAGSGILLFTDGVSVYAYK
jgi:outer membrane protein assembly factor BamB